MRKWTLALVFVLVVMLFAGCGGGGDEKAEIESPAALAEELLDPSVFGDIMTQVDAAAALPIYFLEDAGVDSQSSVFYFSTGATADELAIVQTTDVDAAVNAFNQRVEVQSQSFANYVPEEVPKLEEAIVVSNDSYVVLCVAENVEAAQEILNKYF